LPNPNIAVPQNTVDRTWLSLSETLAPGAQPTLLDARVRVSERHDPV
jgi:hypothetical protein